MPKKNKNQIRVGVNLLKQLSTTFYPHSRMIFDELVTNARDAMATKVLIDVGKDSIIIEDNGEGMSKDELTKFFYISHSLKHPDQVKESRGIKRKMIGKFGLGKLSMYQMCKNFKIVTYKKGYESTADFDFEEFEKNEFIDELNLVVKGKSIHKRKTGTRIVLRNLKKDVNVLQLRRGLQKTMPLTPDFKVYVNSENPLKNQKLVTGTTYNINETIPSLGNIHGKIVFTEKPIRDEAGVYVRVFGRVVNENNPRIIELRNLTHAHTIAPRLYADLNVDGLNDAIQSNRGGFVSDNPKYVTFLAWLKRTLNKYSNKESSRYKQEKKKQTVQILPKILSYAVEETVQHANISSSATKRLAKASVKKKKKSNGNNNSNGDTFVIDDMEFKVKIKPLGELEPECVLDCKKKIISLNSLHPLYLAAERVGCVEFSSFKAILMTLAMEMSKSVEEFKKIYTKLSTLGIIKDTNPENVRVPSRLSRGVIAK